MSADAVLPQPAALVFDIGDTLLPATAIADLALSAAADWLLQRTGVDPDRFIAAYRRADQRQHGATVNHLWGLPLEIFGEACGELGVPPSLGLAVGAVYRDRVRQAIRYDPELVRTFHALHDAGIRLGIVSDGTTVEQLDTLHLLGVLPFVDALAISEDVGCEKPRPEIFETALAALAVPADRVWYVGDDLDVDYRGAAAVGMHPILVGNDRPDVRSIRAVPEILALVTLAEAP